ncbi:lactonase family protein [Bacillus sp. JCM 19034]|uniref:lactonase family protein n=1 Tax=Bacillus sp. JCM 19034 TaxID=1481928 RepID=UPI000783C2F1|nr:lactonase family protein [Bacillus sp. JCM 19034]
MDSFNAYIGTYTNGESKGIYRLDFNSTQAKITDVQIAAEIEGPTYLTISGANSHLYAVAKQGDQGGVAAFKINDDLTLTELNRQLTAGSSPCHVQLNEKNDLLFSANYHKGQADVYPIDRDGALQASSSTVTHEGKGPNKDRQDKAHAHFAGLTPDGKYVVVVDLGTDTIALYTLKDQSLTLHNEVKVKPGSGPRHISFSNNGQYAYVNAELSSELIVFAYNGEAGTLTEIQTVSTLPNDFHEENTGGAICLSNDGRFVYASNRGHDSIAYFSINEEDGQVTRQGIISTGGKHPRDFTIDPSGNFILAANRDTSNIVLFTIDKKTGAPSPANVEVTVPNPVCIKFLQV